MVDLENIILTSCFTIFGAILVLVIGQIIMKFFIEPIHEQSKVIAEINEKLMFFANIYSNPSIGESYRLNDANNEIRELGTKLRAKTYTIRWYRFFKKLKLVPEKGDVIKASIELIKISNLTVKTDQLEFTRIRKEVERLLELETLEQ